MLVLGRGPATQVIRLGLDLDSVGRLGAIMLYTSTTEEDTKITVSHGTVSRLMWKTAGG